MRYSTVLDMTNPQRRSSAVRESARRVLVVEDDDDARELLGLVLGRHGFAVRLVASGGEAIEAASEFLPHVVLTDITLPDLDGFELAQRLREFPALAACRLVAITGRTGPEVKQRIAQAGFAGYFVKPISLEDVVTAVGGIDELPNAAG